VVTAPPGEIDLARAIAAQTGNRVTVIEVPELGVLGELIRHARLYVGADTGPTHLAALAGTPVVSLFGPKDPTVYGPWGRRRDGSPGVLTTVTRSDCACRPCGLRRCGDPICMTGLPPEDVLKAAKSLGA
jgi:ADP-heptose:LPS heptosyltransferase